MKVIKVDRDFIDKQGKTYGGMNWYAAKDLEIKYPYPNDTIAISRTSNYEETLKHELIEMAIFRSFEGIGYLEAHKVTVRIETYLELGKG